MYVFFFQAEDGIRDFWLSRGLGDVYKKQLLLLVLRTRGDNNNMFRNHHRSYLMATSFRRMTTSIRPLAPETPLYI